MAVEAICNILLLQLKYICVTEQYLSNVCTYFPKISSYILHYEDLYIPL